MVTAVTSNPKLRSSQNEKRPPLLPTDSDNAPPRRPEGREVSSRYLSLSISSSNSSNFSNTTSSFNTSGSWSSSISSRSSQSPTVRRRAAVAAPKSSVKDRAVSAERRRPVVAASATPSNAERMLMTSKRSLSVSFQDESYSLPVSKVKPPPTAVGTTGGLRKGTPERRKAGVTPVRDGRERDIENSRPSEKQKQLWPGRLRGENSSFLSRSLDYGSERAKLSESGARFKELRKSVADPLNSDCENVLSESTASGSAIRVRGEPRGIVVPANFWQEHKVQDPASPVSNNALNRTAGSSKESAAKKFLNDSPVRSPRDSFAGKGLSPLRGVARAASPIKGLGSSTGSPVTSPRDIFAGKGLSPLRGVAKAASPIKGLGSSTGSLLRGMASPTRCRSGMGNSVNDDKPCITPFMLSSVSDLGRGKSGENRIAGAHELRLLCNRQLQWRLANARLENTLLVQKHTAERNLYNAWEQESHLENWCLFDRDHLNSLSGAIVALEASTIRLPVVGGARADVHKVREVFASAVDLVQAMASSIQPSLSQMEQMNSLVSELSNLSAREHNLLQECKEFLSKTFIPLQVMHCHLKTHALQVQHLPSRQA